MRPVPEVIYPIGRPRSVLDRRGDDPDDIAQCHHLNAGTRTGNQRLELPGRGVLRCVEDDVAVAEGSSAQVNYEVKSRNIESRSCCTGQDRTLSRCRTLRMVAPAPA